jgi:hypothetical protein
LQVDVSAQHLSSAKSSCGVSCCPVIDVAQAAEQRGHVCQGGVNRWVVIGRGVSALSPMVDDDPVNVREKHLGRRPSLPDVPINDSCVWT